MHSNQTKMVSCPFDNSHKIPVQTLDRHILKCKSPNKMNFQQCKFDPSHWINFSKIDEHEKKCQNKMHEDSVLLDLVQQLDDSKSDSYYSKSVMSRGQKKKMKEKQEEQKSAMKLWKEPDFGEWYEQNYKKKKTIADFSGFNDDSDVLSDNSLNIDYL